MWLGCWVSMELIHPSSRTSCWHLDLEFPVQVVLLLFTEPARAPNWISLAWDRPCGLWGRPTPAGYLRTVNLQAVLMGCGCTGPQGVRWNCVGERRVRRPGLGGWRIALSVCYLFQLQNTKDSENSKVKSDLLCLYEDTFVNVRRKKVLI